MGKKAAVLAALAVHPEWSNRVLAQACGVSHPLVIRYRRLAGVIRLGVHNQAIQTLAELCGAGDWPIEAMAAEVRSRRATAVLVRALVKQLDQYAAYLEGQSVVVQRPMAETVRPLAQAPVRAVPKKGLAHDRTRSHP